MSVVRTSHADHPAELVAAYAAGDDAGTEMAAAEALVGSCAECAALNRDLRAIMGALPAMPAPVRTRDFRITVEQAASLRPRGLARILAPFASARFAFAGPAGAGLAALGLAGLLLSGGMGQTVVTVDRAAAPVTSTAGSNAGANAGSGAPFGMQTSAPVAAPTNAGAPAVAPAFTPLDQAAGASAGAGAATTKSTQAPAETSAQGVQASAPVATAAPAVGPTGGASATDTTSPLTGPAALLLGVGVVLVALRVSARRVAVAR